MSQDPWGIRPTLKETTSMILHCSLVLSSLCIWSESGVILHSPNDKLVQLTATTCLLFHSCPHTHTQNEPRYSLHQSSLSFENPWEKPQTRLSLQTAGQLYSIRATISKNIIITQRFESMWVNVVKKKSR